MATLEILERESTEAKSAALATYREILGREAAGSPDIDDATALRDTLGILGLSIADAVADVAALKEANAARGNLDPQYDAKLADAIDKEHAAAKHHEHLKHIQHPAELKAAFVGMNATTTARTNLTSKRATALATLERLREQCPRVVE
jgi:hypothetical protein